MLAVLKVLTKVNTLDKDYVVIIAKRIHLFPFRTQKLSSLALMVLGGQPPGRVRRSHVIFFYYIFIFIMLGFKNM